MIFARVGIDVHIHIEAHVAPMWTTDRAVSLDIFLHQLVQLMFVPGGQVTVEIRIEVIWGRWTYPSRSWLSLCPQISKSPASVPLSQRYPNPHLRFYMPVSLCHPLAPRGPSSDMEHLDIQGHLARSTGRRQSPPLCD